MMTNSIVFLSIVIPLCPVCSIIVLSIIFGGPIHFQFMVTVTVCFPSLMMSNSRTLSDVFNAFRSNVAWADAGSAVGWSGCEMGPLLKEFWSIRRPE